MAVFRKIAIVALILGLFIFVLAMTAKGWDFSKLSASKMITSTYEIEEEITSISIVGDTEDLTILPSEDGKTKFVFYESEEMKHTISYNEGTASISINDTRKWYNYIFNAINEKTTLYLPKEVCKALKIDASTGDITISSELSFESIDISISTGDINCCASASESTKIKVSTGDISISDARVGALTLTSSTGKMKLSNISASEVFLKVTTGDVKITNLTCESFRSEGSTGKIEMTSLISSGNLTIERSTGDTKFEACDAKEIYVETSTGDVRGSFLTEKIIFTKTNTGKVDVPRSTTGGKCEIKTDTGDIKITYASQ